MTGNEFVKRVKKLGKTRGVQVRIKKSRGKGSHITLTFGDCHTIVQDSKRELPVGTYRAMLRQLNINPEDFK